MARIKRTSSHTVIPQPPKGDVWVAKVFGFEIDKNLMLTFEVMWTDNSISWVPQDRLIYREGDIDYVVDALAAFAYALPALPRAVLQCSSRRLTRAVVEHAAGLRRGAAVRTSCGWWCRPRSKVLLRYILKKHYGLVVDESNSTHTCGPVKKSLEIN